MRTEVIMPKLGFTMEEGTINCWFKKPGDRVTKGEALFEVTTDKANMEVEAPESGILLKILSQEGETVPVTNVVALIGEPGDDLEQNSIENPPPAVMPETAAPVEPSGISAAAMGAEKTRPVRATPAARRLAREAGLDLSVLQGTGPDGTITEEDVRKGSSERPQQPQTDLRRVIAQNLSAAWNSAVMVTLLGEVDGSAMVAFRQRQKAAGSPVTYTDLIVRATALALREIPIMNASWSDGQVIEHAQVNIGLAVDTAQGLVVPVIHDADNKSLADLAAARASLAAKARAGRLSLDEMSGGTFTISNLGQEEIEFFTPIIRLPESGVLGVGLLQERPVCRDGRVVAAPVLRLSLTFDHRLLDGAPAARFLKHLRRLLADGDSAVFTS